MFSCTSCDSPVCVVLCVAVLLRLLSLARVTVVPSLLLDRCGIDLPSAVLDKMELNAAKYPAHLVRASAHHA